MRDARGFRLFFLVYLQPRTDMMKHIFSNFEFILRALLFCKAIFFCFDFAIFRFLSPEL